MDALDPDYIGLAIGNALRRNFFRPLGHRNRQHHRQILRRGERDGVTFRVLEASDGIEVIEIGVPAEHVTEIDHELTLPTQQLRPEREWQGQRFVHNVGATGAFKPFRLPGFVARDTTINANTKGDRKSVV